MKPVPQQLAENSTRSRRPPMRRTVWLFCLAVGLTACTTRVVPPPEPPLSVRRGDDAFRYQDYDHAIVEYRTYLDQAEKDDYTARVFYKTALAQHRLGQDREALRTLDELSQRYPKGRWVQVEALRGDAHQSMGNATAALHAWDLAWDAGGDNDRRKLRDRIVKVARQMNDVELARARRLVNSRDVGVVLDRQIALRQPPAIEEPLPDIGEAPPEMLAAAEPPGEGSEKAGTPLGKAGAPKASRRATGKAAASRPTEVAKAAPKAAAAAAPPAEVTHEAPPAQARPAESLEMPPFEPDLLDEPFEDAEEAGPEEQAVPGVARIGCLLPLTGPARAFGERALHGVRLVFTSDSDRLVLKDTGTNPTTATAVFDEMARDPNIVAVVGPLYSDDAVAVAPRAEETRVPLLLLSQRDGLNGRFVLQVGMTRTGQVGRLLEYAMNRARIRRFGVVYPKDSYGTEFLSTFRKEVERRGGTVVGANGYPPGAHGPLTNVATLRKWRDAQNLQAIFLPDNTTAAAQVGELLQREMPDVTLLGVHGWEDLAGQGDVLNGVLFTDGFFVDSQRPAIRDFVERFQEMYGERPGVLEAQAYDAALLAKRALDTGANSRADLLRRLRGLGPVEGATGELQVTPSGIQRRLFLLQVYDGKLREITERAG